MLKHTSLDRGVIKNATECNKTLQGESSEAIACKISNMKTLDQALRDKKGDMEESQKHAKNNQGKV